MIFFLSCMQIFTSESPRILLIETITFMSQSKRQGMNQLAELHFHYQDRKIHDSKFIYVFGFTQSQPLEIILHYYILPS